MSDDAVLPAAVQTVVAAYLEATHGEVPAQVEGLYLVGSAALGDFRPHSSDIDFVAVTAAPPDASIRAALARVHTRLRARERRPFFDGVYVTWRDLAHDPTQLAGGPNVHEGIFHPAGRGERNPITWHTLAARGVRCHGPAVAGLALWRDADVLARWTDDNLERYWRRLLVRGQRLWTPAGLAGLTAWACAWCVLGVSRLHYTLATGQITSKDGAGRYALAAFPPRWARVIQEALRIRRGADRRSLYRSPLARRRDVRAYTTLVIADGHRIYAGRGPARAPYQREDGP